MTQRHPTGLVMAAGKKHVPMDVVYFIQAEKMRLVKIGRTNDPKRRLGMLQVGSPDRLVLRGVFQSDDAGALEAMYHRKWAHLRVQGEWFDLNQDLALYMDECLWQPSELVGRRCYWSFEPQPDVVPVVHMAVRRGESTRAAAKRFMALCEAQA